MTRAGSGRTMADRIYSSARSRARQDLRDMYPDDAEELRLLAWAHVPRVADSVKRDVDRRREWAAAQLVERHRAMYEILYKGWQEELKKELGYADLRITSNRRKVGLAPMNAGSNYPVRSRHHR